MLSDVWGLFLIVHPVPFNEYCSDLRHSAALCGTLRYDDRDCDTDTEASLKTASTLGGLKLQLERFTFWTDCMQARARQLC